MKIKLEIYYSIKSISPINSRDLISRLLITTSSFNISNKVIIYSYYIN